jgi:hypothetical protein
MTEITPTMLGGIARAFVVAAPGHRFLIGDYSGIESRVLAGLAGQQSKLNQWAEFDRTGDPKTEPYYRTGLSFGLPQETARGPGKIGELALGFGGSVGAWRRLAPEGDETDDETIRRYRNAWRAQNPAVVRFWYRLADAARAALRSPGNSFKVRQVAYRYESPFLRLTLPSGRSISYPFAEISGVDKFGRPQLTFMDSAEGKWAPCRHGQGAWFGLLVENAVQGTACDLLSAAMARLEAAGYPVVAHIHDEVIVEMPAGAGGLEEFRRLITTAPEWAAGWPIAAKVRESQRWSKSEPADLVPNGVNNGDDDGDDADVGDNAGREDIEPPTFGTPAPLATAPIAADNAEPIALKPGRMVNATAVIALDAKLNGNLAAHNTKCWVAEPLRETAPRSVKASGDNGAAAAAHSKMQAAITATTIERPRNDEAPPWIDDLPPRPRQSGNGRDGFDDFVKVRSGKILCPFHDDHTPSLEIYPDPDDLHFHCWVCHKHGRLDELNELGIDWQAALKSPTGKAPDALGEDDSRNLERAHELWDKAKPIAGTLGERYLAQTRGVDVSALPANIDEALRFHPRCPFGQGKRHPCLIALFRDLESGERAGIHRIALTPDAQKIDRRMFGRWPRSRAIKLWPADDRLFVGEGIETVLAAATRLQMQPAWAMASTIYLAKLPVISGIAELNILVDRDVHGEAAAAACHRTWKDAGRRVRRLRTKNARLNDFNDLILAKLRLRIVS